MLESILNIDQKVFLFLNQINSKSFDSIMDFISYSPIPGIILLIIFFIYGYKIQRKLIFLSFIFLIINFALTDIISSKGFKDNIKRLRPMHEPQIMSQVHTGGEGRGGGKFGFVSSHATNTFGVAMFLSLLFRRNTKKFYLTFLFAGLVSYSRIYLGKHYPLDIICGAVLGIFISFCVFSFYRWISRQLSLNLQL